MVKENREKTKLDDVRIFWNNNPCGSDYSSADDRKKYFEEIEKHRYTKIRSIIGIADFDKYSGKKVLEVGCGVGTDGRQFVKNGAIYYGINLDEGSTNLAKESFNLFGVEGEIFQMNAEKMQFEDNTFDHVFSLGVIHHSPNTEEIAREMYRVLKPGGTIGVMIYNRTSINYYLNIMFLRKLFRLALYPKSAPKFFSKIMGYENEKNREILERHRQIMLGEKMTKEKWISINTDGPDCPLSKVYNKSQARKIFEQAGFIDIKNYIRYFNKQHYSFIGKLIPNFLADMIGNVAGWHRWIKAAKPLT
jgi:2-polyprenyl-3-methyl-5-hydroxy-6-metoxy-1,4-benzoquinol methylase